MLLVVVILYVVNKLVLVLVLLYIMIIIMIFIWILGGVLMLGFGFIVKEWLWNFLMLIELCKR